MIDPKTIKPGDRVRVVEIGCGQSEARPGDILEVQEILNSGGDVRCHPIPEWSERYRVQHGYWWLARELELVDRNTPVGRPAPSNGQPVKAGASGNTGSGNTGNCPTCARGMVISTRGIPFCLSCGYPPGSVMVERVQPGGCPTHGKSTVIPSALDGNPWCRVCGWKPKETV